jgi:NTE family protein
MRRILLTVTVFAALVHAQSGSDYGTEPVKIGLAFSGGAALGLAHIGVLKVLEREHIPVWCISGNSMGSMIGGVCAAGYRAAQIESIAVHADWSRLFSSSVPFGAQYLPERRESQRYVFQLRHRNFVPSFPSGLVPLQNVEFLLMELLSETEFNTGYDFDSLPIPFRAVAVDLVSGDKVVLRKGRLEQAIRASIAIPGVFAPEMIGRQELVDGGVQQYLPVEPLFENNPDIVIAALTMKRNPETGISLIDIMSRAMDIINVRDLTEQKSLADIVIEPDVDAFRHSDFVRARDLIAAGEKAAEAALPEIRMLIAGRAIAVPDRPVRPKTMPYIRSLQIAGLHTTRASLIRDHIHTRPGDRLDFGVLRSDLVRLFNDGLFDDVDYQITGAGRDSLDLTIDIQEKDYGVYNLGVRYDNVDNIVLGIEVGQLNLGGSGASARAAATVGNPEEYRLGLTGTNLFMFPFGYRLDGFLGTITRSYFAAGNRVGYYDTRYLGGVAEAGYILGRDAFFNLGVNLSRISYYPIPGVAFFDSFPAREWMIGPTFNLEFNNFNNPYFPTSGLRHKLAVFYSLTRMGSRTNCLTFDYNYEHVIPIGSKFLLRNGLDLGTVLGVLPLARYYHTGGGNFVGFAQEEFTTRHRYVLHLDLERRLFNLFGQDAYPFFIQAISNLGAFEFPRRLTDIDAWPAKLHWGLGLGIRTNTPLGPLELFFGAADFGKPATEGELRFNFALTVGREFRYTQ